MLHRRAPDWAAALDINGDVMRPGLVFVGLIALLLALYFLLKDSLGVVGTFLLQAAVVVLILAGALWFRFARPGSGWFFFRTENDDDESKRDDSDRGTGSGPSASDDDSSDDIRKAS